MAISNKAQPEEHYEQDHVWNDVVSLIQKEAKAVHALVFLEFTLDYKILKHQIASKSETKPTNHQQNIAALQSNLDRIIAKKSALKKQFQDDLGAINRLKEENKDRPTSLTILDVTENNVKELKSFATNHQPNVQTLEKKLSAIEDIKPAVEEAPTPTNDQANTGA
ncbi:MAG: hypothetical protein Q8R24_07845 [Legionellaceae bacterium]|nr:hypothetical protein [Legionellaceae bacterium]